MAPGCAGGKSALRRVQTSNDTCVGVESQLRWVQDRSLDAAGDTEEIRAYPSGGKVSSFGFGEFFLAL